jgi:hypothetical protein
MTEREGRAETQPVRRGSDWPRKNSARRRTLMEVGEPSKKITLRVLNSAAFKEGLRQMRDTEESAGRFPESHVGGLAVVFEAIADEQIANSSTQAKQREETPDVRIGPVITNISEPISPELDSRSKSRSEYSLDYVQAQFPENLVDETPANTSSPGTRTIAAGYLEEATRFDAADLELEGAPSELEALRGDSNQTHWLEQLKAATSLREAQGPATRFSTIVPPLIVEHTHPVLELSSSAIQSPLHFAGNRRVHDLIGSYVVGQQHHSMTALQPSEDMAAISTLAALVQRLTLPEDRVKVSAELGKDMSTELWESLDQNRIPPLLHRFRDKMAEAYGSQRAAAIISDVGNNAGPSHAIHEWERFSNQYALKSLADSSSWTGRIFETQRAEALYGGAPFLKEFFSETPRRQVMHRATSSLHKSTYEKQGWRKASPTSDFTNTTEEASDAEQVDMQSPSSEQSGRRSILPSKVSRPVHDEDDNSPSVIQQAIHATPNLISKLGMSGSAFNEGFIQRKLVSVHPPPMNRQRPNIYFNRNPQGSSIGAHSFDPLVGLPDHSDPRTFHTPNSKDWPHVLAALQPSIDHFRQLTDGAEPREMPLDSGYEVAHTLLQANLRSWFVINRPGHAHSNAIPKLFKLERWEGGIEHWKFASNSPVGSILPHVHSPSLTFPGSSNRTSSSSAKSFCNATLSTLL